MSNNRDYYDNGTGTAIVGLMGTIGMVVIGVHAMNGRADLRAEISDLRTEISAYQSQINNYVAETGKGDITCNFAGAKLSFSGKPLDQIEAGIRPAVERGLKTGACVATLAKGPR
jgi:hypothetical protein